MRDFFGFSKREFDIAGSIHGAVILNYLSMVSRGAADQGINLSGDGRSGALFSYAKISKGIGGILSEQQVRRITEKLILSGILEKIKTKLSDNNEINLFIVTDGLYQELVVGSSGESDEDAETDKGGCRNRQGGCRNRQHKNKNKNKKESKNKEKEKDKKEKEIRTEAVASSPPHGVDPLMVLSIFNRIVDEKGKIPIANSLTVKRSSSILKLSKTMFKTIQEWETYFYSVYQSAFLLGANKRKWRANLDWLLNETNAAKVIDGNYFQDNGSHISKDTMDAMDFASEMINRMNR